MDSAYTLLLSDGREIVTRIWADAVFEGEETQYAERLSYRQLIDHLPGLLDEIGGALDRRATRNEIAEASRRTRYFLHVRFQQGCLIDEVAQELSLLHEAIGDLLWRESFANSERDWRELRAALKRTNTFFDELMKQLIVVYAASLRPPVPTHASIWYPTRQRRRRSTDHPPHHTEREG